MWTSRLSIQTCYFEWLKKFHWVFICVKAFILRKSFWVYQLYFISFQVKNIEEPSRNESEGTSTLKWYLWLLAKKVYQHKKTFLIDHFVAYSMLYNFIESLLFIYNLFSTGKSCDAFSNIPVVCNTNSSDKIKQQGF